MSTPTVSQNQSQIDSQASAPSNGQNDQPQCCWMCAT